VIFYHSPKARQPQNLLSGVGDILSFTKSPLTIKFAIGRWWYFTIHQKPVNHKICYRALVIFYHSPKAR